LVLLATHSATARAYQTSKVLGDYVPCLFNDDEQHAFRDKATLVTEEEAFALKQKVLGSAPDAAVDIAKIR
jgi:hypothetical protein